MAYELMGAVVAELLKRGIPFCSGSNNGVGGNVLVVESKGVSVKPYNVNGGDASAVAVINRVYDRGTDYVDGEPQVFTKAPPLMERLFPKKG